jgi:magnesium transporter
MPHGQEAGSDAPGGPGEPRAGVVRIHRWAPSSGPTILDDVDALTGALADPEARVWIDLVEPTGRQVAAVADALGLHPLVAEDIAERNQRAKVELTDEILHVVLFAVAYAGETHLSEVDLVLGRRFLVSSHDALFLPDEAIALRRSGEPSLARGPDFVLWALCDAIVDGYFPVLDRIEDELDQLQDDVLDRPREWILQRVFRTKRELIELRRAITPAREVFNQLTNRELDLIRPEQVLYFRDVYDHLIRVTDELDTDRELVAGTLDVYLTSVNNELSAIMKRLTGVTVILAGIGAIAGIFGMSEAGSAIGGGEAGGFWLVSAVIGGLAVVTAIVLRRIDWI